MLSSILFKLNKELTIKVYHGYGDNEKLMIMGHVFKSSPFPRKSYSHSIWSNTKALIKLFMAVPYEGATVNLNWGTQNLSTQTNSEGFFKLEWQPEQKISSGWHPIEVTAVTTDGATAKGQGKILVPAASKYTYISDIDDTFLISHSSNMLKRLRQLFTKNPQTRKPFEDVARHYQLLSGMSKGSANPFFYVSSSEWNLYEYIKEFCRAHKLPEGVFLLSTLRRWHELLSTGQGKHETKYTRICNIIKTFPNRKYILLGDDTQKDPEIYTSISKAHPENIIGVYIRRVKKSHFKQTQSMLSSIEQMGIATCYYEHSTEAILHSEKLHLI